MLRSIRTARATLRSLRIYYGDRQRAAAMDRLYGNFVRSGDLVFDVGAHVGDRVASFRRLGARVVAVEPQRAMVRALRLIYGRDRLVTIEPVAVGGQPGRARMLINSDNPTVSSVSSAFVAAAEGAPGWEAQRWSESAELEVTTLDALIARHGVPTFIKIDVEGFEAEALSGLSQAVRIHHHPAGCGAVLHRAMRSNGLRALQRGTRGKPGDGRRMGGREGDRALAQRAAPRRKLG